MKIVNENNIKLKKYGVSDPSLLNSNETILYESGTSIYTMEYVDATGSIIYQASGISMYFKNKLKKLNGFCSLGGQFTNANIYSPKAKTLSGYDRICYIKGIDDSKLLVTEYYGSRGSKYSGYYPMLLCKIKQNSKFNISVKGQFNVDKNNVDDFVHIVNELIDDIMTKNLMMLKVEDRFDKVTVEGNIYYYNIIQWDYNENHKDLEKDFQEIDKLKENLEGLLKYILLKDTLTINGTVINISELKASMISSSNNLGIKDKVLELGEYLSELSSISDDLKNILKGSISDIYDSINENYIDTIIGFCTGIQDYIDILNPNSIANFQNVLDRIEKLVNTAELMELASFNSENYAMNTFRKLEEDYGYDEDLTDKKLESSSGEAADRGEELYHKCENVLEELSICLNQLLEI